MIQCPICLQARRLVLDHNHATGEFRGEICNPCNSWLGLLELYPENYYTRKGRKEWRRWVYENAERIREHLERHTGTTCAEAKRARKAGMELSAVGPNPRAGNPVSAQVPGPATMTAGRQRSTLLPRVMPDSEVEKPGQCRAAAKPPVRGKGLLGFEVFT